MHIPQNCYAWTLLNIIKANNSKTLDAMKAIRKQNGCLIFFIKHPYLH